MFGIRVFQKKKRANRSIPPNNDIHFQNRILYTHCCVLVQSNNILIHKSMNVPNGKPIKKKQKKLKASEKGYVVQLGISYHVMHV